jgi:hypothetical protein
MDVEESNQLSGSRSTVLLAVCYAIVVSFTILHGVNRFLLQAYLSHTKTVLKNPPPQQVVKRH